MATRSPNYRFLERVTNQLKPGDPALKQAQAAHLAFLEWEKQPTMDNWKKVFLPKYGAMILKTNRSKRNVY